MRRRGLGRGLEALLPASAAGSAENYRELPVDLLDPNPEQPRSRITAADLEGLAASIASSGLIEPIVARERDGRFQIIAGERRWRAARQAGLERVPVVIREVADERIGLLALVENLQREDLNPMEESRAFRRLADEAGLTHEQIAAQVGRSRTAVTNTLRLLELAPEVRELIEAGSLRAAAGRALMPLEAAEQRRLAAEIVRRELSVREVERRVRALQGEGATAPRGAKRGAPGSPAANLDANSRDAQERMQRAMGLPVKIGRRGNGGTVVIRFFSEGDLQRVFARLTAGQEETS